MSAMGQRKLEGKRSGRGVAGRVAIVVCQHVLLWTALYIAASTIVILIVGAITVKDIPSVVLLLVSSVVSLFYVALHNTTTKVHASARNLAQCERADTLRSLAIFTLRLLTTLWLVAAAINITGTASRQPLCELDESSQGMSDTIPLDRGTTCILNRVGLLSGFVALLVSGVLLLLLLSRIEGPFRCHVFGVVPEHRILPLFLPAHKTAKLAMRSEMSFKCRSSTSIETDALAPPRRSSLSSLIPAPRRNSSAKLLPPNPRNALGLGIYTSRAQLPPAVLAPSRPSMTKTRSRASAYNAPPPPSSPLPPLPAAYIPYTYQPPPATPQSAGHPPPHRPARPMRTRSFMAEPITKPSTALMELHLAALNRNDSSSSMYSRSTSGATLPALSESGASLTPSSSTSTLRARTPLEGVTFVSDEHVDPSALASPRHVISKRLSSWEVNDAKELEARVSSPDRDEVVRHGARAGVMDGSKRVIRPRKKIRKTRGSTGREHGMF